MISPLVQVAGVVLLLTSASAYRRAETIAGLVDAVDPVGDAGDGFDPAGAGATAARVGAAAAGLLGAALVVGPFLHG
jgi:hypothetical protein